MLQKYWGVKIDPKSDLICIWNFRKVPLPQRGKIVLTHKKIWIVDKYLFEALQNHFFCLFSPMKNSCMSESRVHSLFKGFCATRTTKITKNLIFANVAEQTRGHLESRNYVVLLHTSRDGARSENLSGQVVMLHNSATWQRLLFCQNLPSIYWRP